MKFARDLSTVSALTRHRARLGVALLGAALLASCGGGEQEETFRASRIVTFGDENTLIRPDGTQYTVNNTTTAGVVPCVAGPIWVQYVAAEYGLSFGECSNLPARASAVMKAAKESKVADVAAAVAAFNASATPMKAGDLTTLMVGTYDVLEISAATPAPTADQLAVMTTAAFERGRALGSVVLAVAGTGAKVLFTTIPNLGITPQGLRNPTTANALTELSKAFNNGLSDRVSEEPSGGGHLGAVLEVDQLIAKYAVNYSALYPNFTNYVDAACNNAGVPYAVDDLPGCTTVVNANSTYLWSGSTQFGLITHGQLGSDAVARLLANPL
jgi:outer membrane lipase/esterase